MILTQHFTPELTAGRFRLQAFTEELVARGHEVEVVAAVPNHPRGVIEEGYRGRPVLTRYVHGARVRYVWVLTTPRKSFWTRIGLYASYTAAAVAAGLFERRPDVVLASSPPLTVGAAGALLARRHRTPWVLDVRDVWPDSAVALGELTNRWAIAAAERLEHRLYASASAIVTVNDAFRQHIAERAPARAAIEVIPNGTTRDWLAAGEQEPERSALGLPADRFIWAYAGNVGLAHGLDDAVEAARLLGDGFSLLIIGDGPRREEVRRRASSLHEGLVELRPLMPPGEAARHLRAADALLVSERQEQTIASKLYDYAAVGRPVIAACRGELRRVVTSEEVGVAVPYGDPEALADGVRALRDEPELGRRLVRRGRQYAGEHLRAVQASRLADSLEAVALDA